MLYYDIGLNLFCRQFHNPEHILQEAEENGVCCILTGSDMKENEKVNAFIPNHDVYGTCGIHPHNADSATQADFVRMKEIHQNNPKIVAVGECGLDYDRMFSTKENQIRCLEKHIVMAEELDKPMFLHERSASEDFIKRFKKHPEICKKSVVHCFTGDRKTLEAYLEMGFFIGITGWICDDRRAGDLREAVKVLPLERVLLETDAPYLTPKNVNGLSRVNVPQNIRYVAEELAKHMHVSVEELTAHAKDNTETLFQLQAISGENSSC
ncbi:MAG: TatD family hydrolase [Oscillospiraceae bacterium]